MKIKTMRIFSRKLSLKAITALLSSLVLVFSFYSCTDDEGLSEDSPSSAIDSSINLLISSSNISDISVTRGLEDDEYAKEGEFINSLCVFVCDENGKILDKRCSLGGDDIFSSEEKSLALYGNLEEWTWKKPQIGDVTQITVYAFANWETCNNTELNSLINKEIGETISTEDLKIEISDPASLVDLTNSNENQRKYIPMSGKQVFNVSDLRNTTTNEIELIRLVGKVTIDISDLEDMDEASWEVTLKGLTFSSTASKVLLFSDYQPDEYSDERSKTIEIPLDYEVEMGQTTQNGKTRIAEFYVNETLKDENFQVTLSVEENDGDSQVYGPVTTTGTTIPRNSVYPLILSLDPYSVRLTVWAWTSIIGVDGELLYDLVNLQDYILAEDPEVFYTGNYSISLYDITSKYTILPTLWNVGTDEEITGVNWEWIWVNQDTSISDNQDVDQDTGALTATQLTATPGFKYEYLLKASWGDFSERQRSYNINVTFIDSDDMPILTPLSSRAWRARSLGSEVLKMIVR